MSQHAGWPLILLMVGLGGCSASWPPSGHGGLAEVRSPPPVGTAQSERAYAAIVTATEQLVRLRAADGAARFPGRLVNAERLLVRIRREFDGGLIEDTESDLGRLHGEFEKLEARLRNPSEFTGGGA